MISILNTEKGENVEILNIIKHVVFIYSQFNVKTIQDATFSIFAENRRKIVYKQEYKCHLQYVQSGLLKSPTTRELLFIAFVTIHSVQLSFKKLDNIC